MREILFRGKRDNGEWVVGNLFVPDKKDTPTQICMGTNIVRITYDVIPETVGQYTGLTDKNGKKIFEGDIVKECKKRGRRFEIKIYKGCWIVSNPKGKYDYEKWDFLNTFAPTVEVIGNMFDNPELLKGGADK